jgi:hypothetical protein
MTADTSDQLLDFAKYVPALWTVQSKSGARKPFALNVCQQIILYEIRKMEAAGLPVRMKILKSRQQGLSTLLTAFLQHSAQTRPGFNAFSIADKLELPALWLRRARQWHEQTPASIRPKATASNRIELYFADIESRYSISSESAKSPGMGQTLQAIHMSEISSWRNFARVCADMLPAVPQVTGTMIAMESTGEMEGDDWHRQVMLSLDAGDDFQLIFLPFWLTAEYSKRTCLDVSEFTTEERDLCETARKWARENPEHAKIANFTGLTPAQIVWRRWTIQNEFFGDVERFKSRYPATISEAFLGVGSLALPANMVRYHKSTCIEPIAHLALERRPSGVVAMPAAPEDDMAWNIYEGRVDACEYTIGGDSSSGRVSDPQNPRSERDRAALVVLNRRTLTTVAVLRGAIEPDKLGAQMLLAAEYWNNAWIAPEVNNTGYALVAAVRDYPYIIAREGAPDLSLSRPLHRIGFQTDGPSRNMLISDWEKYGREEPVTGYDGKIRCLSSLLADEERTFVLDKQGKKQHRAGCHDDVLFASMLALQAHLRCPHEFRGLFIPHVITREKCDDLGVVTHKSYERPGGVDDEWQQILNGDYND